MGAQLRVVRRRIRSVQSTMKITRAMELIAASRIVKAQQRVMEARPYADLLTAAMEDVARQTGSIVHPLLEEREAPARAGVLVMTSDRGLAGSFNANLLKRSEDLLRRVRSRGLEPVLYLTGKKAIGYFRFRGVAPEASWFGFSEVPRYDAAEEIGARMIEDFGSGRIDELHTVYTDFRSSFTFRATDKRFLPIAPEEVVADASGVPSPEYIFEPEPAEILDDLLPAVRHHEDLLRAARVRRLGERRSAAGDGGRDRQRGRAHQGAHPAGQPRPPGRDHDRDHGDRGRGRGPGLQGVRHG